MKLPSILKRKKLHAATAVRRSRAGLPASMDYEEMGEPNMKLSRALLIVLLLHVVAVAGIIAFNTIKTRDTAHTSAPEPVASTPVATTTESEANPPNEITQVAAKALTTAPANMAESTKTSETMKAPELPKPVEKVSSVPDSGKIYTVVKGDNPVTIAKHFHVDYAALLELNQITDPRKLQIGTKLHIPQREETAKHKSD